MKKIVIRFLIVTLICVTGFVGYFSIGSAPEAKEITWGVNFSQKYAQDLGLDWKETYLALLDDLGARHLRVAAHWDLIEPIEGEFNFDDLDWKIKEAENRQAKVILVIGMKTTRWPESHIPWWAARLEKGEQQKRILKMLEEIVLRYRGQASVWAWQVENEPFFDFGINPWMDKDFLKKEIDLVRSLDPTRPIIITDTGEWSSWITVAGVGGDIVGVSLYRRVDSRELWFFRPIFYWRRAQIINWLFGKEVICVELQAEPWPLPPHDAPLEEHLEQIRGNIDFAKKTGFDQFYLWGAEWWYWLKEVRNEPEIWNEMRKLFRRY